MSEPVINPAFIKMPSRPLSLKDQIRARAELNRLNEGEFECFLNTDLSFVVTLTNEAAARLLGTESSELLGSQISEFFIENDREELDQYLTKVAKGKARKKAFRGRVGTTGGDSRKVKLRAIRIHDQIAFGLSSKSKSRPKVEINPVLGLATDLPHTRSLEEIRLVLQATFEHIFPGRRLAIAIPDGSQGEMRQLLHWPAGTAPLSAEEFSACDNMAVRFGRQVINGLDRSGLRSSNIRDDSQPIVLQPTFRYGRLAALFSLTVKDADDPGIEEFSTVAELITEAIVRVRLGKI